MNGDPELRARIDDARRRSLAWLGMMQAEDAPEGVSRISAAHDPRLWPGMLLPGTYNAVMCRDLLGALPFDREALVRWLIGYRRHDGIFRIPGMHDPDVFKRPEPGETWRYIEFHVTNYSLGAIQALDPDHSPLLTFARSYLEPLRLKAWLADRDLRDPWLEGNNIVNLGSFLRALPADDAAAVDIAFEILFRWHDYHRNPATGFWGVGQSSDKLRAQHAMAGSMHNFHLWYAAGRPLPLQDLAVDYALSQPPVVDSACIDVDLVDLLVHAHAMIAHRRADTNAWLRTMLSGLLAFQNPDGGFADTRHGIRGQDGWIGGYTEPQGLSNSFATWFRWIAIAMIADLLWPNWQDWQFRGMVGIGYRGLAHAVAAQ
jgi:hypothetical protein